MKSFKSLALASSLTASLAGSAFANTTTVIHIVGAPAFRQTVNDSIEKVVESFDPAFTGVAGLTASTATSIPAAGSRLVGSSIEGAKGNQWLIRNYQSGVDLEINASFTGSTAGVESVSSQAITQNFITDVDATAAHVTSPASAASANVASTPDGNWITNSDTFQASTLFNGTQTFYGGASHTSPFGPYNYQQLTADLGNSPVGVEVFHWVASPNAPSDFTNITTAQASLLYKLGQLPLSFFTGVNADENTTVYALSRDPGSGARTVALAEIGVQPAGTNANIVTYVPNITAGSGTLDGSSSYVGGSFSTVSEAPAGKVPSTGIYEPQGDTGYASFNTGTQNGGSVADGSTSSANVGLLQAITAAPPSGAVFVTYLDNDDTNEALAAGAKITTAGVSGGSAKLLSYNGVTAGLVDGQDDPAVAEGEYTFWSYESFLAPANQTTASADIEQRVETVFPTYATLQYGQLNVSRSTDGGSLSAN
jgi:hypothetical protein